MFRITQNGFTLILRGGAPKGGKGGKGAAKDAGAKATGAAKDTPADAERADVPFPEERLEDQPVETGARHEFWEWSQNLKKEYDEGTREYSAELLNKKAQAGQTLAVSIS